jgi:EAL domain-containing protein (putative c-di-GMP-specific phosphodiesterase class I)
VAEPCAVGEEAAVRASLVRMFGAGVAVTVERFGEGLHRTGGLNGFSAPPMRLGPEVVRQLGDDDASAEAIRRFVALCRSSRLHLIAEAVDNGVTMRILRENGCHLLQGEVVGGTVCAHEIPLVLGTSDVFFRTRLWRTLAGA